MFARLAMAVRLKNELMLFSEVDHQRPYAWSVTRGDPSNPMFLMGANFLHPRTLDGCFEHDGIGPVPGIKDDNGNWDLRPHRKRIVHVDRDTLALFAKLYDEPGTPPEQARLPVVHSQDILEVLRRFADVSQRLGDCRDEWIGVCKHIDESERIKDGTIGRETAHAKTLEEWVVSGPHFYVGTPFNKNPNEGCRHNQDYSTLDLTSLATDFLPRTNHIILCPRPKFRQLAPKWLGLPVTTRYRHVHREMVAPTGERTLVSAIIPPEASHLHSVYSVSFSSEQQLLTVSGLSCSLVVDFFVKSTGAGHVNKTLSEQLPADAGACATAVIQRALQLNCLTTHYADLYNRNLPPTRNLHPSANPDPRCAGWHKLPRTWTRHSALRTPYARRQALVELDALAALSLSLTLDQLLLLYRVQFPILQQYERETFYDQRGKIIFTVNRGLAGVGLARKEFEPIRDAKPGDTLPDYAHDQQGPFEPPFETCDREADMSRAYAFFRERLGIEFDA